MTMNVQDAALLPIDDSQKLTVVFPGYRRSASRVGKQVVVVRGEYECAPFLQVTNRTQGVTAIGLRPQASECGSKPVCEDLVVRGL